MQYHYVRLERIVNINVRHKSSPRRLLLMRGEVGCITTQEAIKNELNMFQ